MALNIIIQPVGAVAKLSAIAKIRKYRGHHEGPGGHGGAWCTWA